QVNASERDDSTPHRRMIELVKGHAYVVQADRLAHQGIKFDAAGEVHLGIERYIDSQLGSTESGALDPFFAEKAGRWNTHFIARMPQSNDSCSAAGPEHSEGLSDGGRISDYLDNVVYAACQVEHGLHGI